LAQAADIPCPAEQQWMRRSHDALLLLVRVAASAATASSASRWVYSLFHRALVPRYLDCEGDSWDPAWRKLRQFLQAAPPAALLRAGVAPDRETVDLSEALVANWSDDGLVNRGYHIFARRIARDVGFGTEGNSGYDPRTVAGDGYIADGAFEGFCLYGLVAALFVQAWHHLVGVEPSVSSRGLAELDVRIALELLGPGLSLDFIGSSSWLVRSIDLRLLVEGLAVPPTALAGARAAVEEAWVLPLEIPTTLVTSASHHLALAVMADSSSVIRGEAMAFTLLAQTAALTSAHREFWLVGLGDHATATLDAALMVRRALIGSSEAAQQRDSAATESASVFVHISIHGLACPTAEAGRHHCWLRCQVLGVCGTATDALAEWLGTYALAGGTHGKCGYAFEGEASDSLATALAGIAELRSGDLIVCSHPAALCILAFDTLWRNPSSAGLARKPMLVHLASTLLFGAPGCDACAGPVQEYRSPAALEYMRSARELFVGPLPFKAIAEGTVLSAQLQLQLGVSVPSCPALALYLNGATYLESDAAVWAKRETVLVTRARLFAHPAGIFLQSLLVEFAISNFPVADEERGHFWFAEALGGAEAADHDAADTWKSWEEMSQCKAALFIPSDIHQRTFIELYRMHVPTFMPNAEWLLRLPLIAPFGSFAHKGALPPEERLTDPPHDDYAYPSGNAVPAFFDPAATSARALFHWYHYSDYAQYPHIVRCGSIPELLRQVRLADFAQISRQMRDHHGLLARGAIAAFARASAELLRWQG